MAAIRSPLFWFILAAYLVISAQYARLTPAWQTPDEPAHYNYVRYLATTQNFPELVAACYDQAYLEQLTARRFPPDLSVANVCYEYHQPPLYYSLGMPLFQAGNGSLLGLRLFSVALGAGVVLLSFFTGHTIFPQQPAIALGTMAFVAFVPMHLAILSSVNNDALAELVLGAILLLLVRRLIYPVKATVRQEVTLGLLLGLGLVTKTTVYIALPLVALTLWWTGSAQGRWSRLAKQAALVFGPALLIALPWYLRNVSLYGGFDLLGLGRHDEVVVGQLRTADFLAEVGWATYLQRFGTTTFHSFWGQFGWMAVPMDGRTYLLLALLTLMALGGLLGFWRGVASGRPEPQYQLSTGQRRAMGLLGLTVLLVTFGYLWYNLTFVQFQGRYLFPALIPLGFFFTLGLREILSPRWVWWLSGGLAAAWGWLILTGLVGNDLDKWAVLLVGLALALATGRAWLARRWLMPTSWLMMLVYGGLAWLALVSPFWFVVPHLSP
jgi:4-amino-4-deoxy-L-arabinose transferase-like glycosyltransferase